MFCKGAKTIVFFEEKKRVAIKATAVDYKKKC
jgi:hypothetical protein